MEAMGIIFSNIYDNHMGELTGHRTSAAIPFGGRYRQIDFALSNMSGAYIRHIAVITKYNYESLMLHLGSCDEWDLTLEETGVVLLPPYATGHTGVYRGKLEALYTALPVLEKATQEYVVLSDTSVLGPVDFAAAIRSHEERGCDLTVICKDGQCDGRKKHTLSLQVGEDGKPVRMAVDYAAPEDYSASMGMFIVRRKLLIDIIRSTAPYGKYHLERDFILGEFNKGTISVNVWKQRGVALFNESLQEYYENSMALLNKEIRSGLFHTEIPIYTKPRNDVPSFYSESSHVSQCIVADGCNLFGSCSRAVLFREVTVEEGATVSDSILMQGSKVGKGATLQHVILDKDVTVRPYTRLVGTPTHPLYIKKGATV